MNSITVRITVALGLFMAIPLPAFPREFNPRDYGAKADGISDDTAAMHACFRAAAAAGGGTVAIPPGDYFLKGETAVPLCSRLTVTASGARFLLPETLADRARAILFSGTNVSDFLWSGGQFLGHVFDPANVTNTWEPNVHTRGILITTTPGGRTANLTFRDITSDGMAGAVITVMGAVREVSKTGVDTFARNVTIEYCALQRSGMFMWDYGYLWQITCWPEDYSAAERAMAAKYFRNDLVRGPLNMLAGDDRVWFHTATPLPLSATDGSSQNAVCFFGDTLPTNLVRGRQYFVVETTPKFFRVAERPGGTPLLFASSAGPNARLIADLSQAYWQLSFPTGSGAGHGAFDVVGCTQVMVCDSSLSSLGDTTHIQQCEGVLFAQNSISGARMGALFLGEFCRNAMIVNNYVNGTNGSRVMSIEKSAENVTVSGNTFINGGRGSWINQPQQLVLEGNVFVTNTTKNERNPHRGRRSLDTGDYEQSAEMYFTTYEPKGSYGNVLIRGNSFTTGSEASAAISFLPGGDTLQLQNNTFAGPVRRVWTAIGSTNVVFRNNLGLLIK